MALAIDEQRQGAVTVLRPEGAMTDGDMPALRQRLLQTLDASLGRFVLDMSAVPFIDSKGLETLMDVTEQMNQSGQSLRLCAATPTVREVLELTELAPMFEQFADVISAVRSFL